MLWTSWHFAELNILFSFWTTNFLRIFSFFSTSILSSLSFFHWAMAIRPLEVCECVFQTPLKLLLRFIQFNLEEVDKLIPFNNVCDVLSLMLFTKNLFSINIEGSSFGYIVQNQMQGLCILLICHYCWA